MKKRYTEEQFIGFLREADAGLPVKELCRKHGFSEPSYYVWKAKLGGMNVLRCPSRDVSEFLCTGRVD
jgi:putative transposase